MLPLVGQGEEEGDYKNYVGGATEPEASYNKATVDYLKTYYTPDGRSGTAPQFVRQAQFFVSGMTIGSKEEEITKKFGPPESMPRTFDSEQGLYTKNYLYENISVYVVGGKIQTLTCGSTRCKTTDGITIGSTLEQVFKAYGPTRVLKGFRGSSTLKYDVQSTRFNLILYMKRDKVERIVLFNDNP
ncbi:MAG: hypothetical protein OEW12_02005 [Deltaproteobacteria bacterium]|nr:hypothetical protein [Deltaproteobacteria bacterium]